MNDDQPQNGGMGGDAPQTPPVQPPMPGGDQGGGMPAPGGDAPAPAPQDPGMGGQPMPGEDAPHGDDEPKM